MLAHHGRRWYAWGVARGGSPREALGEDAAPPNDFGGRLRRLREAAGLTQEELAARAGLSAKAISMLERGERKRPYPHTVRALADALKLSEGERAVLIGAIPGRRSDEASPPVEATTTSPATLPVSLTPLLGREWEVKEIVGLLGGDAVRLLTLTGSGGIGKTRLAIEAVRKAGERFPDGVAFVALAPLGDAALVIPTISRALGLREAVGVHQLEVLRQYLHERKFLLFLDNFEHVAEAAPEVVDLLGSCPNLSVLVTSRAPLRVRGEREYPVSPLAVPDPNHVPEVEEVSRTPAGMLFIERAQNASPAFELTQANVAAVAAICWRQEGLPLALELAAAQTRFLGATALLSRLDRALEVGGARDLPERQRTMRATLDWSHELLHDPERALFRRLSVYAGGFTLEAAEEVGAAGSVEAADVLVLLGNLAEQSLVVVETGTEGRARYRMLEPVRQYALEKLRRSGEEDQVRRLHAGYYLALAEEAAPRIKGYEQIDWLDRLEAENDNLRAAIVCSLEARDVATAARFGWALGMYWVMRTRQGEGLLLIEGTLARGGELPAGMRARALWALGACLYGSGDDERMMAVAEEGVALSRQAGDRRAEAYTMAVLGFAALLLGDLDQAERVFEETLDMAREQGDAWGSATIANHLTVVALNRDDHPRAAGYAEEALTLARRTGDRFTANISLSLLAQMAWATDEYERAAEYWREALVMVSELADKAHSAYCVRGLAAVAQAQGEPRRATRLLGAAESLLEAAGLVTYAHASDELQGRVASAARERLGEEAWIAAWEEGRALTTEQVVEYALEGQEQTHEQSWTREGEGREVNPNR
ncbi:MAG: helix-turn-helix domain-containing protein [Actinomycetota bacterium]|nr:helix-turn-helix domain-containing protein [Actinomycetota bacterium]